MITHAAGLHGGMFPQIFDEKFLVSVECVVRRNRLSRSFLATIKSGNKNPQKKTERSDGLHNRRIWLGEDKEFRSNLLPPIITGVRGKDARLNPPT